MDFDKLYKTFDQYSLQGIHHCDCGCIDENYVKALYSKPLKQVEVDPLAYYIGSAMSTWGDLEHFKYYLPRILELYCTENLTCKFEPEIDLFSINQKLETGVWTNWPNEETSIIKEIILNDWNNIWKKNETNLNHLRISEYSYILNEKALINVIDFENKMVLLNFAHLMNFNTELIYESKFEDFKIELLNQVIKQQVIRALETLFFEIESSDQEKAQEISNAIQNIELGIASLIQ